MLGPLTKRSRYLFLSGEGIKAVNILGGFGTQVILDFFRLNRTFGFAQVIGWQENIAHWWQVIGFKEIDLYLYLYVCKFTWFAQLTNIFMIQYMHAYMKMMYILFMILNTVRSVLLCTGFEMI